jgi:hypothetical protein
LIDIEELLKRVIQSILTRREYKQGGACGPMARYIVSWTKFIIGLEETVENMTM